MIQRTAEHAARKERERFYSLFNAAPAAIAVLRGPDHRFDFINPVYQEIIGKWRGRMTGKPLRDVLPELESQGSFERLDNVYASGKPFYGSEVELMIDRHGGGRAEACYFNFHYQPSFDDSGHVTGILVYGEDVTAQVVARNKKEEVKELNTAISENSSTAHFIVDASGVCRFANPAGELLAKQSAEDITGHKKLLTDVFTCQHKIDGKNERCEFEEAMLERREAHGEELLIKRFNDHSFPASFRVSPMKKGPVPGSVVRIRDITHEKEDLQRKARLEAVTKQRNALARLNRSKDEFIGTASHQLRTPATAVKQYVSFLKDGFAGALNDAQQNYAEQAYASNERQLYVIDELLKIARVDSQHYKLQPESVNVADFIANLASGTKPTLDNRNQTLEVRNNTAEDMQIMMDKGEINVVMTNLLDNASKYSPPGTTITLIAKINGNGKRLNLSVADQGVGIAKEDTGRIFHKFTRVGNKFSGSVNSSGLGLYLARQIVNRHDGSIRVQSRPEHGSVFTVSLPLAS